MPRVRRPKQTTASTKQSRLDVTLPAKWHPSSYAPRDAPAALTYRRLSHFLTPQYMQAQHTRAARRLNAPIHCCTGPSSGSSPARRRTGSAAITPPSPPPTPARPAMCPVPAEPLECCRCSHEHWQEDPRRCRPVRPCSKGSAPRASEGTENSPKVAAHTNAIKAPACTAHLFTGKELSEIEAKFSPPSLQTQLCAHFTICTSVQGVGCTPRRAAHDGLEPFPWNGCPRIGPCLLSHNIEGKDWRMWAAAAEVLKPGPRQHLTRRSQATTVTRATRYAT
jgi:hypothetical protein